MYRLDATNRKLQMVLAGVVAANQLHATVSYSDKTATGYAGGTQVSVSNNTTAVDICSAPAANTVRDIDQITIYNRDTASATVTLMLDVGGTDTELGKKTLAAGESLIWTHGSGWTMAAASGSGVGDVVGPASATDNALARFDGATGKLIQNSGVICDDSNNVSGVAALSCTTIELGHASDTTLARSSAGNVSIEGNVIYRASGTDVVVADGGTGVSSLTAYAVICGGTTSTGAVQSIAGVGTSGQVLTSNGAGALPTFQDASSGNVPATSIVVLEDQKAQNTAGGTFTSGAWRTRDLNTEVSDTGGLCSLSSNQFTLTAGTYEILAIVPAQSVDQHQARLQNTTGATTLLTGTTSHIGSSTAAITYSFINGIFTVAASQALEIQHRCATTQPTVGFAGAANLTTEVYTKVFLRKLS